MTSCRSAFWIFLSALLYESCSLPLSRQGAFSNSLRLTRTIRGRVQQLLLRYKEQHFGNSRFEDRRLTLKTLPSATISYQTWLHMQDSERLSIASRDLHTFWTHLESQRQKLELDRETERESEAERAMQRRNKRGRPQLSLTESMQGIQLDLRDLMRQVNFQLANILKEDPTTDYTSTPSPTTAFSSPAHSEDPSEPAATSSETSKATSSSPIASMSGSRSILGLIRTSTPRDMEAVKGRQTLSASTEEASSREVTQASTATAASRKEQPKLTAQVSQPSRWVSRLEGYIILRDLERYLSRLARDYTLLRAKY